VPILRFLSVHPILTAPNKSHRPKLCHPELTRRVHTGWWRPPDCMRFSLRKIAHAAPIRRREWALRGSRGICSFTFEYSECANYLRVPFCHSQTADPSASLGMTKWRAVTFVKRRQIGWTERNRRSLHCATVHRTAQASTPPPCGQGAQGWSLRSSGRSFPAHP
jgi:hypothetical protein